MIIKLLMACILLLSSYFSFTIEEKHFIVVVPSYNNKDWYKINLDSIFCQNYKNYHVLYIDDCSPDSTGDLVRAYVAEKQINNKITVITNYERRTALPNLFNAIHSCEDNDIVAVLDGDDWFAHENVLSDLNKIYQNPIIWTTYGSYKDLNIENEKYIGSELNYAESKKHFLNNAIRETFAPGHIKTFYAGLFKNIHLKHFLYEGKFAPSSYDIAINTPLFGMAKNHMYWVPEITCIHNLFNHLNDNKVGAELQHKVHLALQGTIPEYKEITSWNRDKRKDYSVDCLIFIINKGLYLEKTLNTFQKYLPSVKNFFVISDISNIELDNPNTIYISLKNGIGNLKQLLREKISNNVLLAVNGLFLSNLLNTNELLNDLDSMHACSASLINKTNRKDDTFVNFPHESIGFSSKFYAYQLKYAMSVWKQAICPNLMMLTDKKYLIMALENNDTTSMNELFRLFRNAPIDNNNMVLIY